MKKIITLLGSTGSIGTQTLDVVRMHGLEVYALAAYHNVSLLEQQVREFHPKKVCIFDESCYPALRDALSDLSVEILTGMDGLCELASDTHANLVLNSVVGMVGLQPTLAAIAAGIDVALANKETLVALKHPNWNMGNKVTIDSATMMNKGLECLEAKWLFDLQPEQITVLVHRQSVMHSGVMYADNSVIAQLGVPDMRLPIQYAILYPERKPCPVAPLSLTQYATLTFAEPDEQTFRCLALAKKAMQDGGLLPCVMNGANEIAVQAFLQGKIGFLEIADYVETAMRTVETPELHTCADVLKTDQKARELVQNLIQK